MNPSHAQGGFTNGIGGTLDDVGRSIAVDSTENAYVTGTFEGTIDLDPGAGVAEVTSAGGTDVFLCKFDSTGAFVWGHRFGGPGVDQANQLAVLGTSISVVGSFEGTVDFDPSLSELNLTSGGASDAFIASFDTTGSFDTANQFGGPDVDEALGVAFDGSGRLLVTGAYKGTAQYDAIAGPLDLTSAGDTDIFVLYFSAPDVPVWSLSMGGTGADRATGIALDRTGNIYTVGTFDGTADMDPGGSVFNLSSINGNLFVCKLGGVNGDFLWARAMGGTGSDSASGVSVDDSGNVLTVGYFQDTADFDPSAAVFNLETAGNRDVFVSKLDTSGDFVWARSLGGPDADEALSVTTDATGNVYTVGSFESTADFDPSLATLELTSAGATDIFLSKLDDAGELVWARAMGGAGADRALSVAVNDTEQVFTTGTFEDTADFDPSLNLANLTSAGLTDVFISRLSRAGAVTLLGDANLDGIVNSTDALWIVQFEFGLREGLTNQTSDLNSDGLINSTDALWAIQIELGQRIQP